MGISVSDMQRKMRKTNRQVYNVDWINDVLDRADVLSLGLCTSDGMPYVIPIRFGREGNIIYIHSSLRGLKTEIIKENPCVAFSAWVDVERHPRPNSTMDKWKQQYRCVCGQGRIETVTDNAEKLHAVDVIKTHYKESLENYRIEQSVLEKLLGIYAIHMEHENPDVPGVKP